MRRTVPAGAQTLLGRVFPGLAGWLSEMVLTHPEQPLAMLPFDLRPR